MRLIAASLVILLASTPVYAQVDKGCTSMCRLEVTHEVTLGQADGSGALTDMVAIARDANGRYLVSGNKDRAAIITFDHRGRPTGRFGRKGKGPGEFEFIWVLEARGNEVRVFDSYLNRLTVLDRALKPIRTHAIPSFISAVTTSSGDVIVNSVIMSRSLAGVPLHLVGDKGNIVRSFGERREAFRADLPYAGHRVITSSKSGGIWATPVNRYELEKWTVDGKRIQQIIPSEPWFKPHAGGAGFKPDRPPPPLISAIREHPAGYLIVAIAIADPQWKQSLKPLKDHPDGLKQAPTSLNEYHDTRIDVFDMRTGKLVDTRTIDDFASKFADDERLASYAENENGVPQVRVWRLRLAKQ
jgi:hypothetical protein